MCDSQALVLQHYSPMPSLSLMNCASIAPSFEKKTKFLQQRASKTIAYLFICVVF